ncbi:MAG: AAA family ATPase, partial [Myxococcota bacterium]
TLDAQLEATIPEARPALGAVTRWMREHPLGKLVAKIANPPAIPPAPAPKEPAQPHERSLDEHSEDLTAAPLGPADTWRALFGQLSEPDLESLARLLRARKNVVLYGPPGTGKTVVSTALAMHWRRWQRDGDGASSVEQVTFHPSYGYEEFVEGFRPKPGAPGEFSLQDGVLKRLASRAKAQPHRQFLLLVDEVNRGDVARIFGELITLIEADKRSSYHARRTMFSQEPLWLTPNIHVLGTMNTADKSISLIDVAIRRRFAFVLMGPEPRLLASAPGIIHEVAGVSLAALLSALNRRLGAIGVPPERHLGHAFFWLERDRIDDPVRALAERFRLDVVPLIEEYCFSERRQIRHVLGNLVDRHGRPVPALFDPEPFVRELRALIEERDDPSPR